MIRELSHLRTGHAHLKTNMSDVFEYSQPVFYKASSNVEQIYAKLVTLLEGKAIDKLVVLKMMAKDNAVHPAFPDVMATAFRALPVDAVYPLLDLARLIVVNEKARHHVITESNIIMSLILPTITKQQSSGNEKVAKPVLLMALRLACNMFQDEKSSAYMMGLQVTEKICHRTLTTALAIECLLHSEKDVRQGAVSLVYNMALSMKSNLVMTFDEDENTFEEWCSEIIIALVNALDKEEDVDVVLRMSVSFVYFVYEAPQMILDVLQSLDVPDLFKRKLAQMKGKSDAHACVKVLQAASHLI